MSIKVGRAHGNGYHDSVVRKITVKHSKRFYDLKEYEIEQLDQNGNIICERDYKSDSIARVCLSCPTSYNNGQIEYMEKRGDIFECSHCGLIKVPKGVGYSSARGKREDG